MIIFSTLIVLCVFLHVCVLSDNIIKEGRKTENQNYSYYECHGKAGCLINGTGLNLNKAPKYPYLISEMDGIEEKKLKKPKENVSPRLKSSDNAKKTFYISTASYNLRTRSKRNTDDRLFAYDRFAEEYARYGGNKYERPWHLHRIDPPPYERPDYYEDTHTFRETDPYVRSLRRQPYGIRSYGEGLSHRIEPRSSQFDGQTGPWPPPPGDHRPPLPNREFFLQRDPPPPPYGRPPPHVGSPQGPPPYGPPPFASPPYEGRPGNEQSPIFQNDGPTRNWRLPPNRKPPQRDGESPPYRQLMQFQDTSTISAIRSDIDLNNNQEHTNNSDTKNNQNQGIATVNNHHTSTEKIRPYIFLFQAQPVTPEA